MKTLVILSLLIMTLSCKVSKKTEVRECTINGIKRDFSECERTKNPQTSEGEAIRVSINFSIELQGDESFLDVLGNYHDVNYSRSGNECEVQVWSGSRWDLRLKGDNLMVLEGRTRNSSSKTYQRYGSNRPGVKGGWYRKWTFASSRSYKEEYLTIHDSQTATLTQVCYFE